MNEIINGIEDSHNIAVNKLEESIHNSAWLTLVLNLLSGFAALGGFFTQRGAALYEKRSKHDDQRKPDKDKPPIAGEESSEIEKTGEGNEKYGDSKPSEKKRWYDKIWGVHTDYPD